MAFVKVRLSPATHPGRLTAASPSSPRIDRGSTLAYHDDVPDRKPPERLLMYLLAFAACAAIVLVAASIGSLEFRGGVNIKSADGAVSSPAFVGAAPQGNGLEIGFRIFFIALLTVGCVSLVLAIIIKQHRRSLLAAVIAVAVVLAALFIWNPHGRDSGDRLVRPADQSEPLGAARPLPGGSADGINPKEVVTSHLSPAATVAGSLALAAVVALSVWAVLRRRAADENESPFDEVGRETDEAVSDLRETDDARAVIIRYYARMVAIARKTSSLGYADSMTPRELGAELRRLGFPADGVEKLTRLFELVRYGEKCLSEEDEASGLDALTTISDFSIRQKDRGAEVAV